MTVEIPNPKFAKGERVKLYGIHPAVVMSRSYHEDDGWQYALSANGTFAQAFPGNPFPQRQLVAIGEQPMRPDGAHNFTINSSISYPPKWAGDIHGCDAATNTLLHGDEWIKDGETRGDLSPTLVASAIAMGAKEIAVPPHFSPMLTLMAEAPAGHIINTVLTAGITTGETEDPDEAKRIAAEKVVTAASAFKLASDSVLTAPPEADATVLVEMLIATRREWDQAIAEAEGFFPRPR
jgi:hypothetical protein